MEQRFHFWRVQTRSHMYWDPAQSSTQEPGLNLSRVLEGLLGRQELTIAYYKGKDTGIRVPRKINWHELVRKSPFQQDPTSYNRSLQVPARQEQSHTYQQTGCLKSFSAQSHPQHILWQGTVHQRGDKKRPQLEIRKSEMGKITGKGRHTVKAGNHPHINMLSKAAAMKREYRGRKWNCIWN